METSAKGRIASLDLGTAKVCAAVGEIGESGQVNLRGVGTGLARGWRSFAIVQPEEVAAAIAQAVTRASRMAAAPVTRVVLSLSSPFYDFTTTSVLVQVSPAHGKITAADLEAARDLARDRALEADKVVLHLLPQKYLVGQDILFDSPLGQPAKTLQVEYLAVRAPRVLIEEVCRLVEQAGPQVLSVVFPPLADSEVMLANLPKAPGYLLLNLGAAVSEAVIFRNGLVQAARIIPQGSQQVTQDIAWALQISPPEAERLKILYGYAWPEAVADDEEIEIILPGRDKAQPRPVYRRFLSEIIKSRLEDIFSQVQAWRQEQLPGPESLPVILTGGGSLLKGLDKMARAYFGAGIRQQIPEGESDIVDSPVYTTAVGLLLYGLKNRLPGAPAAVPSKLSWRSGLAKVRQALSDLF